MVVQERLTERWSTCQIQITFRVQHEIVSGLKFVNKFYKAGIRVAKEETMLGRCDVLIGAMCCFLGRCDVLFSAVLQLRSCVCDMGDISRSREGRDSM
jgi:hypothetical protein